MVAVIEDTLDTTPSYQSTPGDNIFKRQIVITVVCFLPCYTVVLPAAESAAAAGRQGCRGFV